MAANWELAIGAPCYIEATEQLRSSGGYIEQEEALANAYMLRGFRWASSATQGAHATQSLKAFTRKSPPGYNRGADYVASYQYEGGCRELAFEYHECMNVKWRAPRPSFDSLGLYPNVSRIDWRRCPIILVDEDEIFSTLGIVPKFIDCIMEIRETQNFQKHLDRLGTIFEKKWRNTKMKLSQSTCIRSLDFKPWPLLGKGWFSVRVDDNVRAHLRNDYATHRWYAEEVGRHDAMGH